MEITTIAPNQNTSAMPKISKKSEIFEKLHYLIIPKEKEKTIDGKLTDIVMIFSDNISSLCENNPSLTKKVYTALSTCYNGGKPLNNGNGGRPLNRAIAQKEPSADNFEHFCKQIYPSITSGSISAEILKKEYSLCCHQI